MSNNTRQRNSLGRFDKIVEKIPTRCVICSKEFLVYPSHKNMLKTCSKTCAFSNQSRNRKGVKKSDEHKIKIGLANSVSQLGLKQSKETREKRSIKWIGSNNPRWNGGIKKSYRIRKINAPGSHTKQEWENLKKEYNNMCLCCKQFEPNIKLSEDHIIPLSLGGSDDIKNIQPLCILCNQRKATKSINFISEYFTINGANS